MTELFVNEINFTVTTRELAEDICTKYVVLVEDLDLVWLWPNFRPWDRILKAAGYDPNKIDYAVPQPWLDQQYDEHGSDSWRCHAFWNYDCESIFGEPLYQKKVLDKLTSLLRDELKDGFATGWLEIKEAESVKL